MGGYPVISVVGASSFQKGRFKHTDLDATIKLTVQSQSIEVVLSEETANTTGQVPSQWRVTMPTRYFAVCGEQHGLQLGWNGETRDTYGEAQEDADKHNRQWNHDAQVEPVG